MAVVTSVNLSEAKGVSKHPVPEIELRCHHGIVGDAHAGDWHRQVSLLAEESVDTMRAAAMGLSGILDKKPVKVIPFRKRSAEGSE